MDVLFEDFVLDMSRRELTLGGSEVALEPQVFDLLAYLIGERERVVDKDELVQQVWKGRTVSDSTIESRLSVLRKALHDDGRSQRLIRTYARKGVRFIGEVRAGSGLVSTITPRTPANGTPVDLPMASENGPRPSVAVIPFDNLSGDAAQDHLAVGIAADLIGLLTRCRTLFVLARNASFAYRHSNPTTAAAALQVDYLVDGTIRCAQGRLRISFQLVDTRRGCAVLAEHYDSDMGDIFSVQDDIAEKIAGRIEPEIGHFTRQALVRHPPRSLEAWDYFHLGMSHLYRATPRDNLEAQAWLRRAVQLDPQFSHAYAFLSYAMVLSMIYFDAPPLPQQLDEALRTAQRAAELDDQDASVRFALGRVLTVSKRYDDAIDEMTLATGLNPALAVAWCGLADSYVYNGDFELADPLFQHALDLSPHDPMRWAFLSYRAQAKLFARDFARANAYASQAVRAPNCHYWPFAHRLAALGHLGASDELVRAREQMFERKPDFNCDWTRERLFYVLDADQVAVYVQGLRCAGVPDSGG